ncbi:hypothetical protein V8F20_009473 [Naviculisporaceae sp. PSN 640]
MNTGGVIALVIFLLLIGAAVGWIVFTRIRAQRLGLPPPSFQSYIPFLGSSSPYGPPQPRTGGIVGWFNDRIRSIKNRNNRTAAGAYEGQSSSSAAAGRRGFGPLDPDDAWDSRVDHEAHGYGPAGYYEEQELGLASHHHDTSYDGGGGGSYPMNLAAAPGVQPPAAGFGGNRNQDEERGRPRSREPGAGGLAPNPFDDDAEPSNLSLRGVSPRPIDTGVGGKSSGGAKDDDSPSERKSVFREDV